LKVCSLYSSYFSTDISFRHSVIVELADFSLLNSNK
jgi:hypothetical protein